MDPAAIEEVVLGCANQAGEDNRNVARMAALLAGLPVTVPGSTINRLCASGLDAVVIAARAIKAGEMQLAIAGGVESMSRAPFVMPKADAAFSRQAEIFDTTIGWRFVNPLHAQAVRRGFHAGDGRERRRAVLRDAARTRMPFALRSQQRTAAAYARGFYDSQLIRRRDPAAQGRAAHRQQRRASARGHHARAAREAAERRFAPMAP